MHFLTQLIHRWDDGGGRHLVPALISSTNPQRWIFMSLLGCPREGNIFPNSPIFDLALQERDRLHMCKDK